jgi:ankyrin repeat protein
MKKLHQRLAGLPAAALAAALLVAAPPAAAQQRAAELQHAVAAAAQHERPIHDAARAGTQADVERLLAADTSQRDVRTPLGATPLHHAAMNVDTGPLKALVAAGADPNARDAEGRTPLHMAAFSTRTANARLLLRAGADPQAKTDAGRDVLSMARKVRADELAGEVSLWILKGCKPGKAGC